MLYTQNLEKLVAMRLEGMAQALEEQRRQSDISSLDFEARLAMLIERQWLWKENRALAARLHYAQLKLSASLEDIDYRHPRGLKRAQIEQLRASQWVQQHRNCLITGPTGCGKTYLACALGHQACRDGHRTSTITRPSYFERCKLARSMAVCPACSRSWPERRWSSSTILASPRWRANSIGICWKSSTTARGWEPRSSPAS